jgi:hypothetical protein
VRAAFTIAQVTTPAASGDRGGMVLTGTTMELAGTPGPATVISDVALELSREGITAMAPGTLPATVAWSALAGARCGEPGVMPDGSPAVAVSAFVAGRLVRWLVPSSQIGPERAVAIDLLLASRTGRTDGLGLATAQPSAAMTESAPAIDTSAVAPPADETSAAAAPLAAETPVPAPAAEPLAPAAEPLAPAAEPLAPAAEPLAPTAEPLAPAAEPLAPTAEPPARAAEASGSEHASGEGEQPAPRAPAHAASDQVVEVDAAALAAAAHAAQDETAGAHAAPNPPAEGRGQPTRPPAPGASAAVAVPPGEAPTGRSRLVRILWALIVVLVLGGAALLGLGLTSSTPWASGSPPLPDDQALATAVNLVATNLPAGWTVASTPNGPLSGFVGASGSNVGGIGSRTPEDRIIARLYEECMGVSAARDAVMGVSGPAPIARASSPPFAAPAGRSPMQVASLADVYRSGGVVQEGAAQLGRARFARCFGQAIGKVFRQSAQASSNGSSVSYGTPTVARLRLPDVAGVRAAGADVNLPLEFTGAKVTVQLGFVFVEGGRIEAMLVTFSEASGFPPSLARQLAVVVEHNIAGTAGG